MTDFDSPMVTFVELLKTFGVRYFTVYGERGAQPIYLVYVGLTGHDTPIGALRVTSQWTFSKEGEFIAHEPFVPDFPHISEYVRDYQ